MTGAQTRETLLALFAQTHELIHDFAAARTAEERAERGGPHWSAAEVLAASGAWMDYTVDRIGYFARGETAPTGVDFEAVNVKAVAEVRDRSWEEIIVALDESLTVLTLTVAGSPPGLLERYNTYGDGTGGPLWGEVRANGFTWPAQEMQRYERSHGRPDRVAALQAMLTPVIGAPADCQHISPAALADQLRATDAPLILDVRDAEEYAQGRLVGAVNRPLEDLLSAAPPQPTDRLIVTYCNMHNPGYSRGERAAEALSQRGNRVAALEGGYPAWAEAGHPIESAAAGG
jgi:rhodanese-related sulfurtransferase